MLGVSWKISVLQWLWPGMLSPLGHSLHHSHAAAHAVGGSGGSAPAAESPSQPQP